MGPTTLFDKSFLQSLSVDESVWFDHFFLTNVCPVFYVETLADLTKSVRKNRTPEKEVSIIASKFPEMHGSPCASHSMMALNNLIRYGQVPMNSQIPVSGGRRVKTADRTAVIYKEAPEAQAFSRWQNGEFSEVERTFARKWRHELESLDLSSVKNNLHKTGINWKGCKTLEDARNIARAVISGRDKKFELMNLAMIVLGVGRQDQHEIFGQWKISGYPPLKQYAPYAAHVVEIEIFFQLALEAKLISSDRASNRTDIAYLFYLPFCMVFVSSDRLHKRCAKLFMRDGQEFVWGLDIKDDLRKLNYHYLTSFSNTEKEQGITNLANGPPRNTEFLVTRLWDRHLPSWRSIRNEKGRQRDPERDSKLIEEMEKITKGSSFQLGASEFDIQDPDALSFKRRCSKRKGSWWQLPKDLEVTDN